MRHLPQRSILVAALCAAAPLVMAAPAGAAIKERFTVDVSAVTTTTFKQHNTIGSSCGVGGVVTDDAHGTQTVSYRVHRLPVLFTFVGPGSAQYRTDYGSHRHPGFNGTYAMQVQGARTEDDPACGAHQAQSTAGCGSHRGTATFQIIWDTSRAPARLQLNGAADGNRAVACPTSHGRTALPPLFEARHAAGSSVVKFARFVFHSHRRKRSFSGHRTWTENPPADGVDTATNSLRWKVTFHRAAH